MMPLDDEPQYESVNNNNNGKGSVESTTATIARNTTSKTSHTKPEPEPEPEPELPAVEIPYIPLDTSYKRSLIESAIAFVRPGTNKKKRIRTGIDAVNEVEAAASEGTVIPLRMMVEEPILCFLPLESGSVCVGCVSEGDMLRSVHVPCAFSHLCGYCLSPFDNNKSPENRVDTATNNGKQNKKRKSSASVSASADEEFSLENAIQKVSWEVGVVNYDIHRSCEFFSKRVDNQEEESASDNDDDDRDDGDGDGLDSNNKARIGPNLGTNCIKFGRIHTYDEPDDADCDLCGRTGGVLQFFSIAASHSSLQPPGVDGWLAHIPCVNWLVKSRWLEMPPPPHECAKPVSIPLVADGEGLGDDSADVTMKTGPLLSQHKSMFDSNYAAWRCVLCGSQDGIAVRCCGVGCTVRAHPLCITHAGSPWQLMSGFVVDTSDSDSDQKMSVPLFRCKVHSGLDAISI